MGVTGKPFEALPVCLEGLGYVQVGANDEGVPIGHKK